MRAGGAKPQSWRPLIGRERGWAAEPTVSRDSSRSLRVGAFESLKVRQAKGNKQLNPRRALLSYFNSVPTPKFSQLASSFSAYRVSFLLIAVIALVVVLLQALMCFAGSVGGEPGRFLSYGAGGRPLAMGGAFYAVANDATAAHWNPAGLADLERKEFTAMYAQLFADTTLGFLAYAHPLAGKGTLGLTYTQLTSSGFEKIRVVKNTNGDIVELVNEGSFEDAQSGLSVSWGKSLMPSLHFGAAGKLVTRQLDTSRDSHLAMDISLLSRNFFKNYNLGFGINNVFSIKSGDTDDRLPLTLRVGNNYKLLRNKMGIGLDLDMVPQGGLSWRFGGEYWILPWIAFRFGMQGDPAITDGPREMNFGAGLNYQNFALDLASAIHDLGLTTRFSGTWRFGGSVRQGQEDRVRRLIQLGFDAFRNGSFLLALQRLNQAWDAQPGNKVLAAMVERLQEVVAVYPQAAGSGEIQAFVRKGVAQFVNGTDMKGAVNSLRYAFNKNVKDEKTLSLLNMVERAAGAGEVTGKVEGPQIFTWIDQKVFDSRKAFHDGQYDLVIRRSQDILDLEPNNVTALEILGSAFFMLDEKEKAAVIWRRVLEITPENKTVRSFLEAIQNKGQ